MTDDQIVEHVLSSVSENDPPAEVPEGLWCFTDEGVRGMLHHTMESLREFQPASMFSTEAGGKALERMERERDQARDELQSIQRTRHDAYAQCLAAMVLLERAVAVRIDDDWLKEARALLKAFKA